MLSLVVVLNFIGLAVVNSASIGLSPLSQEKAPSSNSSAIGLNAPRTRPLLTINTTSFASEVDPRFRVNWSSLPVDKISGKSCLISVVKLLEELSVMDFHQAYSGGTYQYDGYRDIAISILDTTKRLTYRFAIWGLYRTISSMFKQNGFYAADMVLTWDENGMTELGRIVIYIDRQPGITAGNHTQNPNGLASNVTGIRETGTDIVLINDDPRLVIFPEFYGATLSLAEVFITINLALVKMASHPTTDIMPAWGIKESDRNAAFEYVPDDFGFQWGYGVQALGRIPEYMFAKKKFNEIKFLVGYNKLPVGNGYLWKMSSVHEEGAVEDVSRLRASMVRWQKNQGGVSDM